jgi:hypothetical protein
MFSAFGSSIDDFGGPGELSDPFQKELLPGVPLLAAGFGLFLAGGVLAGSAAARPRRPAARGGAAPGAGTLATKGADG